MSGINAEVLKGMAPEAVAEFAAGNDLESAESRMDSAKRALNVAELEMANANSEFQTAKARMEEIRQKEGD